ncbi:MAG: SurA N-terminal domain-containing protein [Paramuribaculum sp.]|nr:SurA N-terminal domain-containing protein [Paramuribaculum sp.]
MATLEKIRSKSVLLLTIIGLALLAFIIGDFFTSGRTLFGGGTTVAKISGHKIDVNDFQARLQVASQQAQNSGQDIDPAVLQQQVLSTMVQETLMKEEMEKLGLKVTEQELSDVLVGNGSAYVNMFVQQQYGVESAAQLLDVATNPAKYNLDPATAAQFQTVWKALEDEMEMNLLRQKFANLFNGTITANVLDAKALYDENASTSLMAYAKKDYATLADNEFEVTPSDVNKKWSENKELYRIDEQQRSVNYIAVPIVPSQDDLLAAEQAVEDAVVSLRMQPDTEGLSDKPEFVVRRQRSPLSALTDARIKAFADTASVGEVGLVSHVGNDYTLAKMFGKTAEVDSVNIDFIVMTGNKNEVDSVIALLNNSLITVDSLATNNPAVQAHQSDVWMQLSDGQLTTMAETLRSASTGVYFTPDTVITQGARIIRLNERKAPVTVADIAVVTYTVEPSRATVNSLDAALRDFVNKNNTAAAFNENAAAAGYTSVPAFVSASTPQLNRINSSRQAVRWAMEAKKGEVSPVFGDETSGNFIAVAVDNIYDDYIPASDNQLNQGLRAEVLSDLKSKKMISEYAGKANDLKGYANLMGVEVDTTNVTFGQAIISGMGYNESNILGAAAAAQPGSLVGPLQANNGVVVFQIINVDNSGRPYNYLESANNFNRQRGAVVLNNLLPRILQGNDKIDNRLMRFYRD